MIDLEPALTLKPEDAFFILLKAREFGAKEETVDPDAGSNPADDNQVDVLQLQPGDVSERELLGAVARLDEDERLDLLALIWIGRGDFEWSEWAPAREAARMVEPSRAPGYVRGMPMGSDYLQAALSDLGYSLEDYLDGEMSA